MPNWQDVTTLLLAIEVLSPTTARYDRLTKRRLYQQQGIEYWIVDLDGRVVERWLRAVKDQTSLPTAWNGSRIPADPR